jgi:4-oxalocrotonate tautomerase
LPYVNVKITRDGVSREQKRALVAGITDLLVQTLGKQPEHIHIVIDEVEAENWGFAGELTDDYRKRQQEEPG